MRKAQDRIGSYLEGFARFWAIWPNRVAKKAAEKAWRQHATSVELEECILAAVERQKRERAECAKRGQWVPEWPYPATWLRGERWTDEPLLTFRPCEQAQPAVTRPDCPDCDNTGWVGDPVRRCACRTQKARSA